MFRKIMMISLLLMGMVTGCSVVDSSDEQPIGPVKEDSSEEPIAGMANPASVYCEEQGGVLDIREDETGGQYGVCIFEDGSECEEWAFFREECQPGDSISVLEPAAETPRYVNDVYGFSLDPISEYDIEEWENYAIFRQPDHMVFIGFRWMEQQLAEPWRTGMPAGEWMDGGFITVLDAQVPRQTLVYEGQVQVVAYDAFQVGDLMIAIWADVLSDQGSAGISDEAQAMADELVESFNLLTDDVPALVLLGG